MWFFMSSVQALVLATLTYRSIPDLAAFLVGWAGLAGVLAIADRLKLFPPLTSKQRIVHRLGVIGFPLIISGWFGAQHHDLIGHQGLPNRMQHLMWAAGMVALLLPVLARWWNGVSRIERIVMAVGLVVLIGNGVEVVEYKVFASGWANTPWQGMRAWRDTMLDLMMNIIGASAVAWLVTAGAPAVPGTGRHYRQH